MLESPGLLTFLPLTECRGVVHGFADARSFGGFDAARDADRSALLTAVLGSVARGATSDSRSLLVRTTQTHSSRVAIARRDDAVADGFTLDLDPADGGVDGLVTRDEGLLLHAISADCPLLLLAAPTADGIVVGVAHCGWRGVARGIVDACFDRLIELGGEIKAVRAAVGPGARGCCYEVGDEVVAELDRAGVDVDRVVTPFRPGSPDGAAKASVAVDLPRAIGMLLERRGVGSARVDTSQACTICGGEQYHSYRRSGARAGRMSGVIGITTGITSGIAAV